MTNGATHYKQLVFHHANLNRQVTIVAGTISAYHWSDNVKATLVYTTGGVFPVSESETQVKEKIENLTKGDKNV